VKIGMILFRFFLQIEILTYKNPQKPKKEKVFKKKNAEKYVS